MRFNACATWNVTAKEKQENHSNWFVPKTECVELMTMTMTTMQTAWVYARGDGLCAVVAEIDCGFENKILEFFFCRLFVWNWNSIQNKKWMNARRAMLFSLTLSVGIGLQTIFFCFFSPLWRFVFGILLGTLKRQAKENENTRKQSNQNLFGVCVCVCWCVCVDFILHFSSENGHAHIHTHLDREQCLLFLCKRR